MGRLNMPCRSCGLHGLEPIIDLGSTPLANSLLTADQLAVGEPTYPLELALCRGCSLAQITKSVPPSELFLDYLYYSSFSDTLVRRAGILANELVASRGLDSNSLVMEIASNDGYLLQHYVKASIPVLGIEPAANIARVAREERGVRTISEFFGAALATELRGRGEMADVIHANNVLAHVPDLNGFVLGIASVLKPGGVAVIEVPYLKNLLDHREFDTIYHEHLCYFTVTALESLFRRHGLMLQDVELVPIHGGSLRAYVTERGSDATERVHILLEDEKAWGVGTLSIYQDFARSVARLRDELIGTLSELKASGASIAAYGAAAKGSTLLNCFGIGLETIDFVADRSTYKQGRYMPGVHIPIRSPRALLDERPDYCLLLAWNFADEVMRQQTEYKNRGGRFINPIPKVQII